MSEANIFAGAFVDRAAEKRKDDDWLASATSQPGSLFLPVWGDRCLVVRDEKRCGYWMGELIAARKRMTETMQDELARYLADAEWTRPVEQERFWSSGPAKWIRAAAKRGVLALLAAWILMGAMAAPPAGADPLPQGGPDTVENGGRRGGSNSGAGGN